jgi:hypothetical protein
MSAKMPNNKRVFLVGSIIVGLVVIGIVGFFTWSSKTSQSNLTAALASTQLEKDQTAQTLSNVQKELDELKNSDQIKRNDELESKIKDLHMKIYLI